MDNNLIEILLKMFSSNTAQNSNFQQNPAFQNYPFESYSQMQNNNQVPPFSNQNNLLPMLLSLLGNKAPSLNEIFSNKKDENKKAEISSASNDELLL